MLTYGLDEIKLTPYSKTSIFTYAHLVHGHVFFEFTVILEGRCHGMINGKKSILQKGDMIFIRPGDYHSLEAIDKNYSHRDFYVTEEKMRKICNSFSEDFYDRITQKDFPLIYKMPINEFSSLDNKSLLLIQDDISKRSDLPLLDNLHTSVISQLLGIMVYTSLQEKSIAPLWLSRLYFKIQQFYYIHDTVEQIVNTTGYTHSYVCKKFKQFYGMTLLEFHNKNKVIFSTTLLGHQKIIDIATLLNWDNPKNYTIEFKKIFGIPPSEFIKQSPDKNIKIIR